MSVHSTPFPMKFLPKYRIIYPLREVSKLTVEKNNPIKEEDKSNSESVELTEEGTVETATAEEQTVKQAADSESPGDDQDSVKGQLKALTEKNAELEKKLEEAGNRSLRLQADFENFRRRTRMESAASEKYRAQKLILDILPAIDNFERALKTEVDHAQAKALKQGMEMVYRSLLEALTKEGVETIDAVGKEFDPHLHQAVMQGEDENLASNMIIEEFQKGYKLKDRVIRPSMVKVNK